MRSNETSISTPLVSRSYTASNPLTVASKGSAGGESSASDGLGIAGMEMAASSAAIEEEEGEEEGAEEGAV